MIGDVAVYNQCATRSQITGYDNTVADLPTSSSFWKAANAGVRQLSMLGIQCKVRRQIDFSVKALVEPRASQQNVTYGK